jgi:endonuclease/exonuclease/phosphatase family metal-dependent hydrolase
MKSLVLLVLLVASQYTFASKIEIMSYNLENLFDTVHDVNHEDFEYLPFGHPEKSAGCAKIENPYFRGKCFKNNWDDVQFNTKMDSIIDVVRRQGKALPDVLALIEIESELVLSELAKRLGYEHFYITKGNDKRGINIGVLINLTSKLNIVSYKEIELDERQLNKATRNILEVTLILGRETLKLYINHWPSQSNPTSDRMHAARTIEKLVVSNNRHGYHSVVIGDLNVRNNESPNPINDALISGKAKMADMEETFRESDEISRAKKNSIPPSSYYYRRGNDWSKLDRILLSQTLLDGLSGEAVIESFNIYAHPYYSTPVSAEDDTGRNFDTWKPVRFDYHGDGQSRGASDHFPVSFKIEL